MVHFQSWIFVAAMKQKYKQAVSELSHTQESQIVTTPTQPQLNLSLGWHQNSDSLTRIDWYQPSGEGGTRSPPSKSKIVDGVWKTDYIAG